MSIDKNDIPQEFYDIVDRFINLAVRNIKTPRLQRQAPERE